MKEVDESDTDEETEQVGNNFIGRLDNLSNSNSKAVAYFFQRKQENQKRTDALQIMSQQLKKSRDKYKKYSISHIPTFHSRDASPDDKIHVFRGMDSSVPIFSIVVG